MKFKPPFLGAAYYPEAWPLEQIDEDVTLMKETGLNVARIGEFAWAQMEPEEGRYNLGWLHSVVDKLAKADIATVMCTPTCTPPVWLTEKYPELLAMDDEGYRRQHGERRHTCPNSPVYRDYCKKIVTRLAEEFGNDENVIAWQIDNEMHPIYARGSRNNHGCCCPVCHQKFVDKIKEYFGTIEELNNAWGTNIWSQTYSSFAQLSLPVSRTWHHPSLLTAWMNFQSDSFVEFTEQQAEILHRLSCQPVGTDMKPTNGFNYHKSHRTLDFVQFNHYDDMDNLWRAVFWFDFCRPIKDKPMWCMETSTCWNGANIANGYREPGFCRANSWLPIALGGEANLYWLWRSQWSGQEVMHGSVISSCGRGLHIFDEVKEIAKDFELARDFLNGTKCVEPGLAIHFSGWAEWFFRFQPMVEDFSYGNSLNGSQPLLDNFYRPLMQTQLRADVIDPAASLDLYKVICSPFLPTLEEADLQKRLKIWIEAGGTWIVGPFSDIRTMQATKYKHSPFGILEDWAGVYCKYQIPGKPRDFHMKWTNGRESYGSIWYDGFELRGAEALAVYTEGPLEGLAAITRKKMGKGQVILLGTLPQADDIKELLVTVCAEVGITPVVKASENLLVVPRYGKAGTGLIVVELENKAGAIEFDKVYSNILTGEQCQPQQLEVKPYEIMVLKEK